MRDALGLDALALLRDRNFLIFFAASILICIPLAFYYQHANQFLTEIQVANAAGIQTLGQVSEVAFMLLVPFFLKRFGMKLTLLIGMLAWAARYVLFAYGNAGELVFMLILGIALHGVCYDFFFVSGQVFTDSKAGPRYKSAAQGLITLATYGVGMLIGFWVAGQLTDAFAIEDGGHDWRSIWLYPAAFAALVAVLFGLLFKNEVVAYQPAPKATAIARRATMASHRYNTVDVFTADAAQGQRARRRARRGRTVGRHDAAVRALDELERDDVPAAADGSRTPTTVCASSFRAPSCRSLAIRRSAPATRGSRPAASRARATRSCSSAASASCACGATASGSRSRRRRCGAAATSTRRRSWRSRAASESSARRSARRNGSTTAPAGWPSCSARATNCSL